MLSHHKIDNNNVPADGASYDAYPITRQKISFDCFKTKQQFHKSQLSDITNEYINRANQQSKHAVIDFLFEYYSFRPARLLQWSPGLSYCILPDETRDFCDVKSLSSLKSSSVNEQGAFCIDAHEFPKLRLDGLLRAINLLKSSHNRAPNYGCFGLHEWAMIYEARDIRHPQLSLRFSHKEIRSIVESHTLKCHHYDAYRFFSKSAVQFNAYPLDKDNREAFEQPGCLHANMDLYRWAFKYYPWVDSDLIRSAFLLAKDIREVDMRASPYDVSCYDLTPIKIETLSGKNEYIDYQKYFFNQAKPLRLALLKQLKNLAYQVTHPSCFINDSV